MAAYVITFQDAEMLRAKLERVCDTFSNGKRFDLPQGHNYAETIKDLEQKIRDTRNLIRMTNHECKNYLSEVNSMGRELEVSHIS